MRRTLIAGNWKMNGSFAANRALLEEIKASDAADSSVDILVCAPAPYLVQCQQILSDSDLCWGAQDVSSHVVGAFTGEISASMLVDCGCRYVIVGHSERRTYLRESNELVAQKAQRALEVGLIPIICVGESLSQREQGLTKAVVGAQLQVVLDVLGDEAFAKIVVAYEPVWAIGTGRTATPEMAQEVHAYLRTLLARKNPEVAEKIQILYGGSMKPENAPALLAMRDIDGGLIGGAALKASDFMAIVAAARVA